MTDTHVLPFTVNTDRPMPAQRDSRPPRPHQLADRIRAGLGAIGILVMLGLALAAVATEPGWWKLAGVVGVALILVYGVLVAAYLRSRSPITTPNNGDRPSKRPGHVGAPSERTTRRDA